MGSWDEKLLSPGKLIKNNKYGNKKYCPTCAAYNPQETKQIKCADCGKLIIVSALNNRTCRCDECQKENDKKRKREWKQKMLIGRRNDF